MAEREIGGTITSYNWRINEAKAKPASWMELTDYYVEQLSMLDAAERKDWAVTLLGVFLEVCSKTKTLTIF